MIIEYVEGILDISSDGSSYFLIYEGSSLIFSGTHVGQLTSGNVLVIFESFDTEQEMIDRSVELNLILEE